MNATLVPIDSHRTVRRRNFSGNGQQVWEAHSADGVWSFVRIEDTGTPWMAVHNPTGWQRLFPSLPKCRRYAPAQFYFEASRALAGLVGRV